MVIIFKLIDKIYNVVYIIFILNKVWLIECMNKWIKIFFNINFFIFILLYVFIIIKIIKYLCIIDIFLDLNFFYKREFYKYDVLIVCFYNVKFEWFLIKKI